MGHRLIVLRCFCLLRACSSTKPHLLTRGVHACHLYVPEKTLKPTSYSLMPRHAPMRDLQIKFKHALERCEFAVAHMLLVAASVSSKAKALVSCLLNDT